MIENIQRDLIFDLGLHKGLDSEFYLKKGFRVVGLEAVPELCACAKAHLHQFGDRLTIVNKALHHEAGKSVTFYTVPGKDDWGSLYKDMAGKGVQTSVKISVDTIDLKQLLDQFGTPYYIKCDMEGGDIILLEQLLAEKRRPTFISTEMNDGGENEFLQECGYELGQIVNQWMHPFTVPPNPPLEGKYVHANFTGETSGLFGRELDRDAWRPIGQIGDIYRRWKELRDIDQKLAPGWLDVHVCRRDAIGQ